MTTTELVANKIQEILGGNYNVKPYSFFARDYIKPMNTPYGKIYDIDYQAFEEMSRIVPVSVNFQETSPINSTTFYRTGIITAQFYVPVDALGQDKGFNFFEDYEKLRNTLTDGRLAFIDEMSEDNIKLYKAYFTLTEPITDGAIQSTGAYRRMLFSVQGNLTLADSAFRTGDEYDVAIYNGKEFVKFDNITNLSVSRDEQGNAVQQEQTTAAQTPPVSRVHSVSFVVSDMDNEAVNIIRDAVLKMPEFIATNALAQTEAQKREVKVRLIENGDEVLAEFWALLSADYTVANRTSVGSFSITFTRTDDNTQSIGA